MILGATAFYMGYVRSQPYYGIQPDDYHTYDKEALKKYWTTGDRFRARKRSRAILTAIPIFIVGAVIIVFFSFIKIAPAHGSGSIPTSTPISERL